MQITNYSDFFNIVFIFLIFLCFYILIYRKFIFSLFDPLLFFLISMSFSCVLFIETVNSLFHVINFFAAHLFFYFGFLWGTRSRLKYKRKNIIIDTTLMPTTSQIRFLKILVMIAFVFWISVNIYALKEVLALLSNNPTVAKSENFEGGLGWVRRINWGLGPFLLSATLVVLMFSKSKAMFALLLVVQVFFAAMSGGKGSILGLIFTIAYLSHHPVTRNNKFIRRMRTMQPALIILGAVVALSVLLKEKSNLREALFGLATRFLYFGDSVLFYYQPQVYNYFDHYNVINYLSQEFNGILGFFRLIDYQKPMGYVMLHLDSDLDQAVIGPNTPFYIKSTMFFGPLFGLLYSSTVGWIVASFRRKFFMVRIGDLINFILLLSIATQIFTLASESELFVNVLFDMYFWILPIVIIVKLINRKFIKTEQIDSNFLRTRSIDDF